MRELIVTENITVDGVIDMAAGWFDPLATDVDQSDIIATNAEHSAAADALLVGRNTFEAFRDFWPKQTDDPTGVSHYLNRANKYVVSRTIGDPGWQNTTVLRGDLVEEVQALKAAPGRDIVATGSVQLVQALVATGLVDEYRLFVFPVVVGRGARLFESGEMPLRLLETRPFISGAVLLRYSSLATPAASTAYEA
jgi:dihydrofolate reductase